MIVEHRSFLEILREESKAKREIAEREKRFAEYVPDQEAIKKFGYDINDPGFVMSIKCQRWGEGIFKHMSPDDFRKRYALYQRRKNMTWRDDLWETWDFVCEITDEIFDFLKEQLAHILVNTFKILKIALLVLPVTIYLLVLWLGAIITIPFRQHSKNKSSEN